LTGNKFYFHEVIGFEIEDQRLGVFGKIVSINDTSAQPLFEVFNGNVEILVPMIDQFLVKIDRENKKVDYGLARRFGGNVFIVKTLILNH
jgi:16S rRNA processing protein RimM